MGRSSGGGVLGGGWGWSGGVGVDLSGDSWDWAPGGVLSDDVVDGDSGSRDQSWGDSLLADVVLTGGDGDQGGGLLSGGGGGDVGGLSGSNSGDGGNSG